MAIIDRGFVHTRKYLGGNKYSWESAPPWVSDGSQYVPYIYSRDESKKCYRIQTGLIGAVIFDTGAVEYHNPELTEARVKGEEWELWEGTKKAKLESHIIWSAVEDSTGVHITREQATTKPDELLKVIYDFRVGAKLKQTVTWTSSENSPVTVSVKQVHLMNFDKVTTDTGISTTSKSEKSIKYKFGSDTKNFQFLMDQSDMVYDKSNINNTQLTDKCLQTSEIDFSGKTVSYTFGYWTLSTGEMLTIDPSPATLNNPTEDGYVRLFDGVYLRFADEFLQIGTNTYSVWRSYVEWDISSIPLTATIVDTVFKYNGYYNGGDAHIHAMAAAPSLASDINLYNDIADGTVYADVAGFPVQGTNRTIDLGATADSDLQALLSEGWFAIGIQADNEVTANDSVIYTEDHAGVTPPPTLYVEYTYGSLVAIGFETGDFTECDYNVKDVNSTLEVITGAKYTETYGMHGTTSGVEDDSDAHIAMDTFGDLTSLYTRFYYYAVNQSTGYIEFIYHRHAGNFVTYAKISGGELTFYTKDGADYGPVSDAYVLNSGQWYCIELATIMGAPGSASLWVNGVLIDTLSGTNNAEGHMNLVYIGSIYHSSGGGDLNFYIDDFEISNSYIGTKVSGVLKARFNVRTASTRSITLYVDGVGSEHTGWIKTGVSPYLDTQDDGDVEAQLIGAEVGDFTFADTAQTGIPTAVFVQVYIKKELTRKVEVWIYDGSSEQLAGTITPDTSYGWVEVDATSILNTFTKINAAKMRLKVVAG